MERGVLYLVEVAAERLCPQGLRLDPSGPRGAIGGSTRTFFSSSRRPLAARRISPQMANRTASPNPTASQAAHHARVICMARSKSPKVRLILMIDVFASLPGRSPSVKSLL
jgi:hypothetical protein